MNTSKFLILLMLVASSTSLFSQRKNISPTKSVIEWTGKKLGGSHNGNIVVKNGFFELKKGYIIAGKVEIDMNSITNIDVKDETYNLKLVNHLKSDDFFGVEKYPTATFTLNKKSKIIKGKATVSGLLTIKGKTQAVTFDITQNGNVYVAQLKVDRSKFEIRYGSNSFFDNLGDKAIDDIFTLDIKIVFE